MSVDVKNTLKIDKKIVAFKVLTKELNEEQAPAKKPPVKVDQPIQAELAVEVMHEKLTRPDFLMGSTYKIKTPIHEHTLFITINDVVLNQGTEHEQRHPYEIFINSKNMDHFMWVVALTRLISAVFRKGGDVTFMVEELKEVFDPKGGYFKKGGRFMPSLVAEIGEALETHLKMIGLLEGEALDEHQRKVLAEKRDLYESMQGQQNPDAVNDDGVKFPRGSTLCPKCHTKAAIIMDGCSTCLNCGDSKCS